MTPRLFPFFPSALSCDGAPLLVSCSLSGAPQSSVLLIDLHARTHPVCDRDPFNTTSFLSAVLRLAITSLALLKLAMDDVADLVVTPFRDIVDKGRTAVENAGDDKVMLKAAQSLVKEGERALKRIEPLCRKHLDEYGSNFLDALKENGELFSVYVCRWVD